MTNDKTNDNTNHGKVTSMDDPRLTAYALGELESGDTAAVEAFLETDEAARHEVEELRAFAGVLTEELASENTPALRGSQRAAIEAAMVADGGGAAAADTGREAPNPGPQARRKAAPMLRLVVPLLAAAALVVAVTWQGTGGFGLGHMVPTDSAPSGSPAMDLDDRVALGDEAGGSSELEALRQMGYLGKRRAKDSDGVAPAGGVVARNAPARDDAFSKEQLEELEALGYLGGDASSVSTPASQGGVAFEVPRDAAYPRAAEPEVDAGGQIALFDEGDDQARGVYRLEAEEGRELSFDADVDEDKGAVDAGFDAYTIGTGRAGGSAPTSLGVAVPLEEAAPVPATPGLVDGPDVLRDNLAPLVQGVAAAPREVAIQLEAAERLDSLGYVDVTARARAAPQGGAVPQAPKLRALAAVIDHEDSADARRAYVRPRSRGEQVGESYAPIVENEFVVLSPSNPIAALSTFGVDVDSASYSNVRRYLHRNELPPADAVRLEELINAFRYGDPAPDGLDEPPFRTSVSVSDTPWQPAHRLVRVALKGREIARTERPSSNLVFLLDVSGSMSDADKLPLLVSSMKLLLRELDERDTISIVTYASGSHVVLPPTRASEQALIEAALDGLRADGSTHASAGIQLAYETAAQAFLPEGNNRVLLATDGDFNVGITSDSDLLRMIQAKAKSKVFLTVLGFGTGNLKDSKAELLADNGNGQYAYIDSLDEAHRVLVEELTGTLLTIAKDVKLQVEFNPGRVAAYRLLGYENRALAARDFRDDTKDAGEIGAGHSVVAYYEVIPTGVALPGNVTLKYQQLAELPEAELVQSPELLTVNLRYKAPTGDVGHEFAVPVVDEGGGFLEASDDLRFGAAVAAFGMLLRGSEHAGSASMGDVVAWAEAARGDDPDGRRAEFVRLARTAQGLLGVR